MAFACVIAFMGIGLVDPILKPIADQLDATPSQVSLLFTSYMAVMGVAMLLTGVISSRWGREAHPAGGARPDHRLLGARRRVGLDRRHRRLPGRLGLRQRPLHRDRPGHHRDLARGSTAQAVILFEAALGLGIATGPLLGGALGSISWRAPFFGVAVLMTIALVATAFLLPKNAADRAAYVVRRPVPCLEVPRPADHRPDRAVLQHGLFTLLAFTPFPLDMNAHQVGLIFFGWGLLLAITSVWVAPVLSAVRLGPTVLVSLTLFGLDLAMMAVSPTTRRRWSSASSWPARSSASTTPSSPRR